jgi:hypothetical protein
MPTAKYPTAVATDADLKVRKNFVSTALASSIATGDTLISVRDASDIEANMLLTIDQEVVAVASVSGNNLVVSRGFDNTAAASHRSGATVAQFPTAYDINALAEEIKAIETALGPTLSNVPANGGKLQAANYDWAAQSPGGSLTSGIVNSITLAPVPPGVNAANVEYYVYISGGVGTAEAVLVTGGTAVAGAASGTLLFTPSNSHSGAWTVQSASEGVGEALAAARASRQTVEITPRSGGWNLYGPVFMPIYTGLSAPGRASRDGYVTVLPATDGAVINVRFGQGTTALQAFHIQSGCTIDGPAFNYPTQVNTDTPYSFPPTIRIFASAGNDVTIRNCYVENAYKFIDATGSHNRMVVENVNGHVISMFADVDVALSVDTFKSIHIVSTWITDTVVVGELIEFEGMAAEYIANNATFIRVKRADQVSLFDVSVYGFKFGIYFAPNLDGSPVGSYGSADKFLADTCMFPVFAIENGVAKQGWQFSNCQFISWNPFGSNHAGSAIYISGSQEGPLSFVNAVISGNSAKTGALVYTDDALITLISPKVVAWSNSASDYPLTLAGDGTVQVVNGLFEGVDTEQVGYPALSPWNLLTYLTGFTGSPARFFGTVLEGTPVINSGVSPAPKTKLIEVERPNWAGANVASASTITPTSEIFVVTGTDEVDTINLPFTGYEGTLCLIPAAAFTWSATGNIAIAGTAVPGRALFMTYRVAAASFYPSYTS